MFRINHPLMRGVNLLRVSCRTSLVDSKMVLNNQEINSLSVELDKLRDESRYVAASEAILETVKSMHMRPMYPEDDNEKLGFQIPDGNVMKYTTFIR
jgi:hypothetical protein